MMNIPREIAAHDAEYLKPTVRILLVFEAVVRNGPITLNELEKCLPMPRAAIWRRLNSLRKHGWLRMRLGDNAFELSEEMYCLIQSARFADISVQKLRPLLKEIVKYKIFHVDVGMFQTLGHFLLVETNRKDAQTDRTLSLIYEPMAIFALLNLPQKRALKHLEEYRKIATCDEIATIDSWLHQTPKIPSTESFDTALLDDDTAFIALGQFHCDGGVLQLSLKLGTAKNRDVFLATVDRLQFILNCETAAYSKSYGPNTRIKECLERCPLDYSMCPFRHDR